MECNSNKLFSAWKGRTRWKLREREREIEREICSVLSFGWSQSNWKSASVSAGCIILLPAQRSRAGGGGGERRGGAVRFCGGGGGGRRFLSSQQLHSDLTISFIFIYFVLLFSVSITSPPFVSDVGGGEMTCAAEFRVQSTPPHSHSPNPSSPLPSSPLA